MESRLHRFTKTLIIMMLLCSSSLGQISEINLPYTSVATTDNAFSSRVNPAGLAYLRSAELFILSYTNNSLFEKNGAFYAKLWKLGMGAEFLDQTYNRYNRYYLGVGFDLGKGLRAGVSYNWYAHMNASSEWNLGLLFRPFDYLSLGFSAIRINGSESAGGYVTPDVSLNSSTSAAEGEIKPRYNFGIAFRGVEDKITVAADMSLLWDEDNNYGDSLDWTFRADIKPIQGLNMSLCYKPQAEYFGAGLSLSFDHYALGHYMNLDENGKGLGLATYLHLTADNLPSFKLSPGKSYVYAELSGVITPEPYRRGAVSRHTSLSSVIKAIDYLKDDEKIAGLVLKLGGLDCGYASVQEIREALLDFKEAGKSLIIYANHLGNVEYYLATAADEIYMPPTGQLFLTGLRMEMTFLKGTLDKLGIVAEMEAVGKYKNAGDVFTREGMSQAHRQANSEALNSLFKDFTAEILYSRGYEENEIIEIINNGPYTAAQANEVGLIDTTVYPDELEDILKERFDEKAKLVKFGNYWVRSEYEYSWGNPFLKQIAIIYATGVIVQGESGGDLLFGRQVGAETLIRAIRQAREDSMVSAIVLRVNSPGGDGLASDLVWREIKKTVSGDNRKPFIVSMGDVAASGGYYISCIADTIIADPGTITGSIGVISGKFDFSGFYDKIGITKEIIKKGERADYLSSSRGWSEEERELIRKTAEEFYRQFLERVAEGRNMNYEEVDEIAQGRIWTGEQAWELGLVDDIGTFDHALQVAMLMGGLQPGERAVFKYFPEDHWYSISNVFDWNFRRGFDSEILNFIQKTENSMELLDGRVLYLMPYKPEIR